MVILYLYAFSVVKRGHFEEVLWVKIAATLAGKLCSDVTLSSAEQYCIIAVAHPQCGTYIVNV